MTEFREVCSIPCDLSGVSVCDALAQLGYSAESRPVLHVHPAALALARDLSTRLGWAFDVKADELIADMDTWFVTFNGQAIGSVGS